MARLVMEKPSESSGSPPPTVQIHVNEELAPSIYANFAQLTTTPHDVKILFGEIVEATPNQIRVKDLVKVYMAPAVAKSLLALLAQSLQKYEETIGPVRPNVPNKVDK